MPPKPANTVDSGIDGTVTASATRYFTGDIVPNASGSLSIASSRQEGTLVALRVPSVQTRLAQKAGIPDGVGRIPAARQKAMFDLWLDTVRTRGGEGA